MKYFRNVFALLTVFFLATGFAMAKEESPETVDGATTIDVAKAKALFDDGVLFIDVRKDKDWAAGRIPDAEHLELKSVFTEESLSQHAKKDDPVVLYCNGSSCLRSSVASEKAVGWGFKNVYYFRLGFPEWKAAGYPAE
jgi:rhodanese-related sulfurtransferase